MADRKPLKVDTSGVAEFGSGDTVGLALGGTGATSASGARTNLGLGSAALISSPAWRGHIYGLTLANNVSDANNDIDVAVGNIWDNSSDVLLELTSGLTKRLDASWAVGSGNGGLDTGSKANSTWYHVWLIRRSDTGVVDALFSTSATSPTMPANYDQKALIESVLTDGSGNIRAFINRGDTVEWAARISDLNTTSPSTSEALLTVSTPPGRSVEWRGTLFVNNTATNTRLSVGAADGTSANIVALFAQVSGVTISGFATTLTNTSSQIRYDANTGTGWNVAAIETSGWRGFRR